MKNPKFWWAFIAFLVAWSLWEIYPPTSRDLIQEFKDQAESVKVDTNFNTHRGPGRGDAEDQSRARNRQFGDLDGLPSAPTISGLTSLISTSTPTSVPLMRS